MFDTVILLTVPAERAVLPSVLLGHNPRLTVMPVEAPAELAELGPDLLQRARLVAFVTPGSCRSEFSPRLAMARSIFIRARPAIPDGRPRISRSTIGDGVRATAHVMVEQVDAGPIVDVAVFALPAYLGAWVGRHGLCSACAVVLAHGEIARPDLEAAAGASAPLGNRKFFRSDYRAMCEIPLDITNDEFERRIRIFGGNHFGMSPTSICTGVEFCAVIAPPIQPADSPPGAQLDPAMIAAMEPERG